MKVSCLMVTLGTPVRLPMIARAVAAFGAQTHGERELVIVVDQRADSRVEAIRAIAPADVRLIVAQGLSLGALRNRSVVEADGDVVCQWDDDDLHHPGRIAAQLAALGAADAVVLQDLLMRDAGGILRWTNWAATPAGGHPGTLMARRAAMPLYPEVGETAQRGEDLAVLEALDSAGEVVRLAGAPHLYVYVSHEANSMSAAHHAMLARTLSISSGLLIRREAALRAGLAPFSLGGTMVEGSNGAAFTL